MKQERVLTLALTLYRIMRMRLKAKGHGASPKTALEILAQVQRHNAKIADRTVAGISSPTPSQLDLFEALNIPKIA